MLKQPGAHDVGGDLRKDAAFLLPLSGAIGLRVLVGSAVTRPDTVVQSVACTYSTRQQSVSTAKPPRGQVGRGLLRTCLAPKLPSEVQMY